MQRTSWSEMRRQRPILTDASLSFSAKISAAFLSRGARSSPRRAQRGSQPPPHRDRAVIAFWYFLGAVAHFAFWAVARPQLLPKIYAAGGSVTPQAYLDFACFLACGWAFTGL